MQKYLLPTLLMDAEQSVSNKHDFIGGTSGPDSA